MRETVQSCARGKRHNKKAAGRAGGHYEPAGRRWPGGEWQREEPGYCLRPDALIFVRRGSRLIHMGLAWQQKAPPAAQCCCATIRSSETSEPRQTNSGLLKFKPR